jgi:hypothetical protein
MDLAFCNSQFCKMTIKPVFSGYYFFFLTVVILHVTVSDSDIVIFGGTEKDARSRGFRPN